MAKAKSASGSGLKQRTNPPKLSASSGNPWMVKTSSMNKSKKRSYKPYRGQGR